MANHSFTLYAFTFDELLLARFDRTLPSWRSSLCCYCWMRFIPSHQHNTVLDMAEVNFRFCYRSTHTYQACRAYELGKQFVQEGTEKIYSPFRLNCLLFEMKIFTSAYDMRRNTVLWDTKTNTPANAAGAGAGAISDGAARSLFI